MLPYSSLLHAKQNLLLLPRMARVVPLPDIGAFQPHIPWRRQPNEVSCILVKSHMPLMFKACRGWDVFNLTPGNTLGCVSSDVERFALASHFLKEAWHVAGLAGFQYMNWQVCGRGYMQRGERKSKHTQSQKQQHKYTCMHCSAAAAANQANLSMVTSVDTADFTLFWAINSPGGGGLPQVNTHNGQYRDIKQTFIAWQLVGKLKGSSSISWWNGRSFFLSAKA